MRQRLGLPLVIGALAGVSASGWLAGRHVRARSARNGSLALTVVGAGPQARVLAVHCARVGMDVTLLTPDRALPTGQMVHVSYAELLTGLKRSARVTVVSKADAGRRCDLVLVCSPLPELATSLDAVHELLESTLAVVMVASPESMAAAERLIGQPSVLVGSLNWLAIETRYGLHALPVSIARGVLGESSGGETARLREAALLLRQAGLSLDTTDQMASWLWSHAGMLGALLDSVRIHGSLRRFALSPDGLSDYLSDLRELCMVLDANGVPVSRGLRRRASLGPDSLSVWFLRLFLAIPGADNLLARYSEPLVGEISATASDLSGLAAQAGLPVPAFASSSRAQGLTD